eukprot:c46718_g1_i1 orf=2-160(-)
MQTRKRKPQKKQALKKAKFNRSKIKLAPQGKRTERKDVTIKIFYLEVHTFFLE